METVTQPTVTVDLHKLSLIWGRLDPRERLLFSRDNPEAASLADPLHWLRHHTKTQDEQDKENPYKPFPDRPYFHAVKELWDLEQVVMIEKSRTMMISWLIAGFCFHQIANFQPSKCIFWSDTEAHAQTPLNYCWTLWEQSAPFLQARWPLDRPRKQQSETRLELKDGGQLIALPGKNPEAIRSEHPSIVVIDEASLVESFKAAYSIAVATKVPKIVCIATAYPSDFRQITKPAKPAAWPRRS